MLVLYGTASVECQPGHLKAFCAECMFVYVCLAKNAAKEVLLHADQQYLSTLTHLKGVHYKSVRL